MSNALRDETSPYLRQHIDNPVDWRAWSADALEEARSRDRPILLSIGYSACHWCHVMAHECFENEAIAAAMNREFVNIKVDREERPDLDRIYQLAHNALTGRGGGWPLTMFLTPDDLLPFFAGTYFPPSPRHGLPSFPQVIEGVAHHYRERRDQITSQNARLQSFFDDMAHVDMSSTEPVETVIARALETMATTFDPINGGHRGGPKFPHSAELRLQLREVSDGTSQRSRAESIVRTTLDAMADRGLYDHLGGGFFRYCVDETWSIPHFEKMLYDNVQLLPVYAEAALALDEPVWLATIDGTLEFLARELRNTNGGLFCALDADSPGGEGAYYVWTPAQVTEVLPDVEAGAFVDVYGLNRAPNFEGHAWHLLKTGRSPGRQAVLERARKTLLAVRSRRPPPGVDDKVLTAWNALAIAGLARTSRALRVMAARMRASASDQPAAPGSSNADSIGVLADRAQAMADAALDHLYAHAWLDGRLYADAHARFPGYLDDHAFLLGALVEQLQQCWSDRNAAWAIAIADALLARFDDANAGGFWFTAHDHEPLPQRPKPWTDDATPSGNAVAIGGLQRMGHLLGETRWIDAADRAVRAGASFVDSHPQAAATFLLAWRDGVDPPPMIVVRASEVSALDAWRQAIEAMGITGAHCFFVGDSASLPPLLQAMRGTATGLAYVCRRGTCSPAVSEPSSLPSLLAQSVA